MKSGSVSALVLKKTNNWLVERNSADHRAQSLPNICLAKKYTSAVEMADNAMAKILTVTMFSDMGDMRNGKSGGLKDSMDVPDSSA